MSLLCISFQNDVTFGCMNETYFKSYLSVIYGVDTNTLIQKRQTTTMMTLRLNTRTFR